MAETAKTPWHLWAVGVASLLWNSGGALDYVMTQTRVPAYLSQFTDVQRAYFTSFPAWFVAAWAIAVWAAVAGSLLILVRRRLAVPVLWISLIAMITTSAYDQFLAEYSLSAVIGPAALLLSAALALVAVFVLLYAIRQRATGVLR